MPPQQRDTSHCRLCDNALLTDQHKSSDQHRFNFLLYEWNTFRKKIVKNRHGVEVSVELVDVVDNVQLNYEAQPTKGAHITRATVAQASTQTTGIKYLFTVKNGSTKTVYLLSAVILHPYKYFAMVDFMGLLDGIRALQLQPSASYSFKMIFCPKSISIGKFEMPIAIQLQTENDFAFSISRNMVIIISDMEEAIPEVREKSPFTNVKWDNIDEWRMPSGKFWNNDVYTIPREYEVILKYGLSDKTPYRFLGLQEQTIFRMRPGYPTRQNYRDFFHFVLWLDEIGAHVMLQRYNMENVTMEVRGKSLELAVPGLAEKRPSLIQGDIVNIRTHNDHVAYKGVIQRVNDKTIWIDGVDNELVEDIRDCPDRELDVSFQLGRLSYERMHAAVDQCISNSLLDCLFPDPDSIRPTRRCAIQIDDYVNPMVRSNPEQRRAVESILNCTSGKAPYIVFGPPGTGKTVTIVEAILQIKRRLAGAKVLVCAPANAACDMLTSKLIPYCTKEELIRVHTTSRDWDGVPDDVKRYSNHNGDNYIKLNGKDLMKYNIVITTLVSSGRYAVNQKFYPNFVFIDEAAQAMEPEADIAIALLQLGQQLVLAGDPKQLGPQCSSSIAEKYNLGVSLLERLMKSPIYQNDHPNYTTMLKRSFRAHPALLELPNELFYDNQLEAASMSARNDPIAQLCVYNKIFPTNKQTKGSKGFMMLGGQPMEFCAVIAKEKRQGQSPSYFNEKEIEMVLKYIKTLLQLTEPTVVEQRDIGVVTPYARQMYKIKGQLRQNHFEEIEVGTTEAFQGHEKRIMIISTVRAQSSLLLHDEKYKLGFVKHEKRFNVAITRAKSKLIVVGCPNVLRYCNNWGRLLNMCIDRKAYFGAKFDSRNEEVKAQITKRLNQVNFIDDQYAG